MPDPASFYVLGPNSSFGPYQDGTARNVQELLNEYDWDGDGSYDVVHGENVSPADQREASEHQQNLATCGACGRTWDDAIVTHITPAPSGRCPFEDLHEHEHNDPNSVHYLDENDPVAAAIFEWLVRWEHSPVHVATKAAALLRKYNLVV